MDEEKAADEKLSTLAEGGINQGAADRAHGEDEEPAVAGAGAKKTGSKAKASSRR